MLIQALIFAFLATSIHPHRISQEENRRLKKACSNRWNRYKSIGGRTVSYNEFPFMASILFKEGKRKGVCSGVLISPRHILTAGHCVVEFDDRHHDQVCKYAKEYRAYRLRDGSHFSIYLGSKYHVPLRNPSSHEVAKIHVHEHWGKCDFSNDLAIIELEDDADPREASPICMPNTYTGLAATLRSAGMGRDPARNVSGLDSVLQVIKVYRFEPDPPKPGVISTHSTTASMCQGDSGGPLFQLNHARKHMLVGIGSTATNCDFDLADRDSIYIDVRKHLDWICRKTGVCS